MNPTIKSICYEMRINMFGELVFFFQYEQEVHILGKQLSVKIWELSCLNSLYTRLFLCFVVIFSFLESFHFQPPGSQQIRSCSCSFLISFPHLMYSLFETITINWDWSSHCEHAHEPNSFFFFFFFGYSGFIFLDGVW